MQRHELAKRQHERGRRATVAGVPYDHGYAWVVVAVGSFILLIMAGIQRSSGIFFMEIQQKYGSSSAKTSLIYGLRYLTAMIASLPARLLIERIGTRYVVMLGGLVTATGSIVSVFSDSLYMLMFSMGFLTGLGASMLYSPVLVLVCSYFKKYRSIASALAVSGNSVGGMLFPPIIYGLIEEYDLHGSFLLCGGVMLNICVLGALLRPLEYWRKRAEVRKAAAARKKPQADGLHQSEQTSGPEPTSDTRPSMTGPTDDTLVEDSTAQRYVAYYKERDVCTGGQDAFWHRVYVDSRPKSKSHTLLANKDRFGTPQRSCSVALLSDLSLDVSRSRASLDLDVDVDVEADAVAGQKACEESDDMSIAHDCGIATCQEERLEEAECNADEDGKRSECCKEQQYGQEGGLDNESVGKKRTFFSVARNLLRNRQYMTIVFCQACYSESFKTLMLCIPPHILNLRFMKESSVHFLMVLHMCDLAGRLSSMAISTLIQKRGKKFTKRHAYVVCLHAYSCSVIILGLCGRNIPLLYFSMSLMGFASGFATANYTVVLAECCKIRIEDLGIAHSLSLCVQSVFILALSVGLGALADLLGTWKWSILSCGVLTNVGCVVANSSIYLSFFQRSRTHSSSSATQSQSQSQLQSQPLPTDDQAALRRT